MTTQTHILVDMEHRVVEPTDSCTSSTVWVTVDRCDGGDIEGYESILSPQQFAVAQMISEGYSKGRIADTLDISFTRVRQLWKAVKRKVKTALDEI